MPSRRGWRSTWRAQYARRSVWARLPILSGLTSHRSPKSNSQPERATPRTIKVAGATVPYPEPARPAITAQMRGNRRSDTRHELAVRSILHRSGQRFRKDVVLTVEGVRVRADIVFKSKGVVVFLDGCFWHGCPEHGRSPSANRTYWNAKLARNVERDARNNALLRDAGWTVLRFWEHESPDGVAAAIVAQLRQL